MIQLNPGLRFFLFKKLFSSDIHYQSKVFEQLRFLMFLKEVSSAHQACIYLIQSTAKTVKCWVTLYNKVH